MKKFISPIIITVALVALFACEKVDGPFVEQTKVIKPSDTLKWPDVVIPVKQNVLIEDFTGQQCFNCPAAAARIEGFKKDDPKHQIISIGMHVTDLAKPSAEFPNDFTTPDGDLIGDLLSTIGTPVGWINRLQDKSIVNKVLPMFFDPYDWDAKVKSEKSKNAKAAVQIINQYDAKDPSKFIVNVRTKFVENVAGKEVKLAVYLVEDSIVGKQKTSSTNIEENYVHRHVFRKPITTYAGVSIEAAKVVKDSAVVISFPCDKLFDKKNKPFVHKNLIVVAFVYDAATGEIIQVEEDKVIK